MYNNQYFIGTALKLLLGLRDLQALLIPLYINYKGTTYSYQYSFK